MTDEKDKGKSVRINTKSYEDLRTLQDELSKTVGFVPSITQIIEHLVSKEMKERQS